MSTILHLLIYSFYYNDKITSIFRGVFYVCGSFMWYTLCAIITKNGKTMAKEVTTQQNSQQQTEQQVPKTENKKLSVMKMIVIGIPLFLVQVVIVYFLVIKFIGTTSTQVEKPDAVSTTVNEQSPTQQSGENIFVIKDIIINPAGTNGNRYLLTTIGLEASNRAAYSELMQKELQVRDILNTLLTSKTLLELVDVTKREALRAEIGKRVTAILKQGTVTNVYFSKYIIQ